MQPAHVSLWLHKPEQEEKGRKPRPSFNLKNNVYFFRMPLILNLPVDITL
jgi:hypothetical protein